MTIVDNTLLWPNYRRRVYSVAGTVILIIPLAMVYLAWAVFNSGPDLRRIMMQVLIVICMALSLSFVIAWMFAVPIRHLCSSKRIEVRKNDFLRLIRVYDERCINIPDHFLVAVRSSISRLYRLMPEQIYPDDNGISMDLLAGWNPPSGEDFARKLWEVLEIRSEAMDVNTWIDYFRNRVCGRPANIADLCYRSWNCLNEVGLRQHRSNGPGIGAKYSEYEGNHDE